MRLRRLRVSRRSTAARQRRSSSRPPSCAPTPALPACAQGWLWGKLWGLLLCRHLHVGPLAVHCHKACVYSRQI